MRGLAGLGGWEGVGMILSILPTCSGAANELSSAHSLAVGTVDRCVRLCIVLVKQSGLPGLAVKSEGMEVDENWREGVGARDEAKQTIL